ncbi:SDR family oxidoreductase [Bdellovibrio sp. HCB337]|uniref:SDR family oxidoreductase n=1 Tax=Bdellovibrio sp. HCB337 TaxID=3394358 RepID=UPI0039A72BD9
MAKIGEKYKPLHLQTIVITGASSGIGLATAEMAAKKNARVVISSRNEEDLQKIADKLNGRGGNVLPIKADVTKIEEIKRLRDQAIEAFGPIDTWVNNAGGSIYGMLMDIPEEEERALFEMNFWSVRHGCHVAVETMKNRGGVIINVGSEVSARSIPLQGMYSATKHAVKAFNDALRMELEHENIPIAVCLIRPTAIDTPFPDHAVNRLRNGEPSLPDPALHPDYVAKAILECAEKPKRDVFVGAASKMSALMEYLMPRTADKQIEKTAFKGQSRGTLMAHRRENEALTDAPLQEGEMLGHHIGKVKANSEMKKPHLTDSTNIH